MLVRNPTSTHMRVLPRQPRPQVSAHVEWIGNWRTVIRGKQEGRVCQLLGMASPCRMARSIIGLTTSERLSLLSVQSLHFLMSAQSYLNKVLLIISYRTPLRKLRAGTAKIKYVQLQDASRHYIANHVLAAGSAALSPSLSLPR